MRAPLVTVSPMLTRINVTPIIDVALVLVIILLVTAPLLSVVDLGITLPAARTRGAEDPDRVNVSLGQLGQVAIDDELVAPGQLKSMLRGRLEKSGADETLVVIRADAGVSHASVREILNQARSAGARRLAMATSQKAGEPSQ